MIKTVLGVGITGSFCTFKQTLITLKELSCDYDIYPILSFNAQNINSRFISSKEFIDKVEEICKKNIINSIEDAEPIGPKSLFDAMLVFPCTGNTLSKLANGITDTPVTMACKAHLRNNKPLVIAVSTNDGLSSSLQNIATLINKKNVFFSPFGQDSPVNKPMSLVAKFDMIDKSVRLALDNKQIQPILI